MRILIIGLLLIASTNLLLAQKILCYKNDLSFATIDNNIKLNGKKCQGILSAKDMIENGWILTDSKVIKGKKNYNHIYIFNKEIIKELKQKITNTSIVKYNLNEQKIILTNTTKDTAIIAIENLKVGQSGIVLHKDINNVSNDISFIVSRAVVIKSNGINSTIKFNSKDLLKQDAIPTTNLNPQNNDTFVLNHLYNTSLLIVPNISSKKVIKSIYSKHVFLEEDMFASYLKISNTPVPTKKDIQTFALKQQLGTVFIVVNKTLYILDSLSMKVIDKIYLAVPSDKDGEKIAVPFYSSIDKIKKSFWSFKSSKIEDYNKYYKTILNLH